MASLWSKVFGRKGASAAGAGSSVQHGVFKLGERFVEILEDVLSGKVRRDSKEVGLQRQRARA